MVSTSSRPLQQDKSVSMPTLPSTPSPIIEAPRTPPVAHRKAYNSTTEISLDRIFQLGQVHGPVAHPNDALTSPHLAAQCSSSAADSCIACAMSSPSSSPSRVVSMSGFGELGRFGNQVLQYMFMRVYADNARAQLQLPDWIGKHLFALAEPPISLALPAVIEARHYKANSTFNEAFLTHIVNSNPDGVVQELHAEDLHAPATSLSSSSSSVPLSKLSSPSSSLALSAPQEPMRFVNHDFWGWFQFHSSVYAPYRERLVSLLQTPVAAVVEALAPALDKLQFALDPVTGERRRRTVVAVHLRRGDYENIAASSFGYVAPTSWYLEWLDRIWPTLDNPVLFVASDELPNVIGDFARYSPETCDSLGASMPDSMADLRAGFYPDFYLMTHADVLGISNSTFSFAAAMLNVHGDAARYYRAHYDLRMIQFHPWSADPILHRPIASNVLSSTLDTLSVVYRTQGLSAVLRNITYELPYYALRSAAFRVIFLYRRWFSS